MSFSQYIYGPVTTEKAINEVEQFGRYSLLVSKKATKPIIKPLVLGKLLIYLIAYYKTNKILVY